MERGRKREPNRTRLLISLSLCAQTDFDAENCVAVVLCDRDHFCADWRGVVMGECAGEFGPGIRESDRSVWGMSVKG